LEEGGGKRMMFMAAHNVDFVRGIALVLQGECLKAKAHVTHSGSIGTLREKMVRKFVCDETPDRFRVETGLINGLSTTSRQCDILIHEPDYRAPLYRWEDFVVVRSDVARAVIEVKTILNAQAFEELIAVHTSVMEIELRRPYGMEFIPTFGYAIDGVTFDTFLTYLQSAVGNNLLGVEDNAKQLNWPLVIAVHGRRYLGFRHLGGSSGNPMCFCAVDFSRQTEGSEEADVVGIETGYFLQLYEWVLRERLNAMKSTDLFWWFNRLAIVDDGKVWITPDGVIHRGPIPVAQGEPTPDASTPTPPQA
jgi:hypothetical protein